MPLSRRRFMGSGLLGTVSLGAMLGTASSARAAPKGADRSEGISEKAAAFFLSVADSVTQIAKAYPDAEGFQSIGKLLESIYPAEIGSDDDRLLQAALFLNAQGVAEMAEPPSLEKLTERLTKPFNSRIRPDYFHELLEKTKDRIGNDPDYARQIDIVIAWIQVEVTTVCIDLYFFWLCIQMVVVTVFVAVIPTDLYL